MTGVVPIDVLNPDLYRTGDPAKNGLPLEQYNYLRETAPIFRQTIADPQLVDEVWVVTRHADVNAIDRDAETYCSSRGVLTRRFDPAQVDQGGKPAMINMDGVDHRRNRRVVSRAFTPPVVRTFEEHFRDLARRIVQRAVAQGTFDFVKEIAVEMPLHAIADLMGVPQGDRAKFLKWINAFTVPTDPAYAPSLDDVMAALDGIWNYGLELAELRRQDPGSDLMSKIVEAVDEDTLSDDELMGFTLLLAGAGADTTRNAASFTVHGLLQHPDQQAVLREQADDITRQATEEMVRWASPVIHFCRTTTREVELHGQEIGPGEKIAILFASANYDPDVIVDPLCFDLARDPNPHLAFGAGPHVCLGRHIAHLELKILFEELMQQTREIRPAGEIVYARDSFLRGVSRLPVRVAPA
jgi:cholest-4-en-3-one 26-monooxygenase